MEPTDVMLITAHNSKKPGMVGRVGAMLGEAT
jgi:hypothetical protein